MATNSVKREGKCKEYIRHIRGNLKDTVRVKNRIFFKKNCFQLAYDFFYALFISEKNIVKNES